MRGLRRRKLKRKGMKVKAVYTPHGGSLHYSPSRLMGRLYIMAERKLLPLTDGLLFESVFAANRYVELVGRAALSGAHRAERALPA